MAAGAGRVEAGLASEPQGVKKTGPGQRWPIALGLDLAGLCVEGGVN